MKFTFRMLIAVSALLPVLAQAALVEAPQAGGAQLGFDAHPDQEITLGPVPLTASNGSQIVFTAATNGGAAGFSGDMYGLGDNGLWTNTGRTYAWQNGDLDGGRTATMTFTFAAPVSSVGGFMNYVPSMAFNPYYSDSAFVLMALGQDGTVLEQYSLADLAPIATPGGFNAGEYRGISRSTDDIYAFEIQGAGVVQYLDFSPAAAVPETSSIAMLLAGLGLLGVAQRRRRRS